MNSRCLVLREKTYARLDFLYNKMLRKINFNNFNNEKEEEEAFII